MAAAQGGHVGLVKRLLAQGGLFFDPEWRETRLTRLFISTHARLTFIYPWQ